MAGPGLRKADQDALELRLRQLKSLHTHGSGQVGPCAEIHAAKALIAEIEERLSPKPPVDLDGKAARLIERFGSSPWVISALAEVTTESEGCVK